jgi:hypothetical protein
MAYRFSVVGCVYFATVLAPQIAADRCALCHAIRDKRLARIQLYFGETYRQIEIPVTQDGLHAFSGNLVRPVPCNYQLPDITAIREGTQHNVKIVYCICKFPYISVGEMKSRCHETALSPPPPSNVARNSQWSLSFEF